MIRSIHLLLAFLAFFAGNANLFAAAGRPLTITDAAGRTMSFSYDSLGHLTQLVSADGQITRYQQLPQVRLAQKTRFEEDATSVSSNFYKSDLLKRQKTRFVH